MAFVRNPIIALSAVFKTNVPGLTVCVIGSLKEISSSNTSNASVRLPLSI